MKILLIITIIILLINLKIKRNIEKFTTSFNYPQEIENLLNMVSKITYKKNTTRHYHLDKLYLKNLDIQPNKRILKDLDVDYKNGNFQN